ncbi:MAG TPA: AraC family transcriptional regulator [Spirillospora sp.]|nr:AraC family transcriptional regulator [Spirillospora sp.]
MEVIRTADVPAKERFAFWHELNSKLWAPYDLRCDPRLEHRFRAQVGISDFGPVQATLITTMPHSIRRTPKLIRQSDPEVFKLGCFVRGGGMKEQDGRRVELGVGDLMLYDTSRPYLGDADLTPSTIAAAHHISLRYLHRLFQQDGHTVAGWIRARRLERCHRDLADPGLAARPINAIAARWGFRSSAHFSQAFRSAYGLSPRQFRQECTTVHAG